MVDTPRSVHQNPSHSLCVGLRVSVGALTRAFPPELVDQIVVATDTREVRRRLLPARLVVYLVLALWLFRGPNCGYGRCWSS